MFKGSPALYFLRNVAPRRMHYVRFVMTKCVVLGVNVQPMPLALLRPCEAASISLIGANIGANEQVTDGPDLS